jgi:hypothetical protein
MTPRPTDEEIATVLRDAADFIKDRDEGAPSDDTGWASDEGLEVWISLRTLRQIEEKDRALKPFAAAVFNDNGDVTIDTSHLRTREYMAASAALSTNAEEGA